MRPKQFSQILPLSVIHSRDRLVHALDGDIMKGPSSQGTEGGLAATQPHQSLHALCLSMFIIRVASFGW